MSTHRYVTVPSPAVLLVLEDGSSVSLSLLQFIEHLAQTHDGFLRSAVGARIAARLLEKFADVDPGGVVQLHPDDWRALHEAAEKPSGGYPQLVATRPDGSRVGQPVATMKFLPLIEALTPENTKAAE
jgi:hypothetical protein